MKVWTPKFFNMMVLGIFVLSLIPLVQIQSNNKNNLQTLIAQVQGLEQSSENANLDFKVIFSDTLSTLQSVAGLRTIISTKSSKPDSQTIYIVVHPRIPYLLLSSYSIQKIEYSQTLSSIQQAVIYQSHIISPETPPPIFS